MDIWERIEQLRAAENLRSDAELARSLGKVDGYFWNPRAGFHRLGNDVVTALCLRMNAKGLFRDRYEELEFRAACQTMPLQKGAAMLKPLPPTVEAAG